MLVLFLELTCYFKNFLEHSLEPVKVNVSTVRTPCTITLYDSINYFSLSPPLQLLRLNDELVIYNLMPQYLHMEMAEMKMNVLKGNEGKNCSLERKRVLLLQNSSLYFSNVI